MATFEIGSMDYLTIVEEVEEAIKEIDPEYSGDLKMTFTKKNNRELKMAIVQLSGRSTSFRMIEEPTY